MNKEQKALFDKAVEFGFDKPEAAFHVKFHEVTLRKLLGGKGKVRKGFWGPSLEDLVETDKI